MIPDTSIFLGYWLWQTKTQKRVVANKEPEKYPPPKKIIITIIIIKIRHTPSSPLHLDIESFGVNVSFLITFSTNQEFI